jgi:ribosomal protein L18
MEVFYTLKLWGTPSAQIGKCMKLYTAGVLRLVFTISGKMAIAQILRKHYNISMLVTSATNKTEYALRLTAHGSRLTAHGSRLTAHGSRLTAHIIL